MCCYDQSISIESCQANRFAILPWDILGSCIATIENATCFLLETSLAVLVNHEVNPLLATDKAYNIIQSGMLLDTYVNEIDALEKLTYVTPTLHGSLETLQPLNSLDGKAHTNHPQWILATCLTLLAVGAVVLASVVTKKHLDKKRINQFALQDALLNETISTAMPAAGAVPVVDSHEQV